MAKLLTRLFVIILIAWAVMPAMAQDEPGSMTVVFRSPATKVALSEMLPDAPSFFIHAGTANINIRSTKSDVDLANVVGVVHTGSVLQVFTVEDGWELVRSWTQAGQYEGFGWVSSEVTSLKTPAAAPIPVLTVPECQRVDEGIQLYNNVKFQGGWLFDALSSGCNLLVEGRQVATDHHHIWVLRDGDTQNLIDTVQYLHWTVESSVWEYPLHWNMGDFATEKPPIAAEFVNAKRANMHDNDYDFPISVWLPDGREVLYGVGEVVPGVTLYSGCDFEVPEVIEITGIYNPAEELPYVASIGADECRVLAWGQTTADSSVIDAFVWTDAQDNFEFVWLTAYMIPESWTNDQISTFFTEQNVTGNVIFHQDAIGILGAG